MITAGKLDSMLEELVASIPALKSKAVIVDNGHLSSRIKELYMEDFPILVGVLPDSKLTSRSLDNQKFDNSLLFFFLQKVDEKYRSNEYEIQVYNETAQLVDAFIEHVYSAQSSSPCNLLKEIDWASADIKPEYNYFSCDGYSMSLSLETKQLEA